MASLSRRSSDAEVSPLDWVRRCRPNHPALGHGWWLVELVGTVVGFQPRPFAQRCKPVLKETVYPDAGTTRQQIAFVFNDGPYPVRFVGSVAGGLRSKG